MLSQAAKDLLWVINSPSFVSGADVALQRELLPEHIDEVRLAEFLEPRAGHRVGHYFEHLLHFWLAEVRQVDLLEIGLQVRDGKRTIGEIDFLYRDEQGLVTHCEASVKFFLHHPRPGTSHYPGPNASDNFERKVTKLFDQQLELSRVHYPQVQRREAFVKGMAFYNSDQGSPGDAPERMPQNHLRGAWYRSADIDELRSRSGLVGAIADKPHWLASCPDEWALESEKFCDALSAHFAERSHPLMISLRDETTMTEIERAFVVSEDWPDRSTND